MFDLNIQRKAERIARGAAIGLATGLMALVGVGFLTAAAWMALAKIDDHQFAATVIGCVYLGLALLGFALARLNDPAPVKRRPQHFETPEGELSPMQMMAAAFVGGLEKGARSRR